MKEHMSELNSICCQYIEQISMVQSQEPITTQNKDGLFSHFDDCQMGGGLGGMDEKR